MKFKLLERESNGLYRIQALKDFGDVKAGDIGGYVASYRNLAQDGNCWIYGNAKIYGNASVYGNARIFGNASVWGDAIVWGNARIFDNASVYGNARIFDNASVSGDANVWGNSKVCDNAIVCGDARVGGNAIVCGDAIVTKDPINILGLRCVITITDNHIQIGYEQFTLEQALMLEYKELEHLKDVIIPLIKLRLAGKI